MIDAEATMKRFAERHAAVIDPNPQAVTPQEITQEEIHRQHLERNETAHPTASGHGVAEVPDLRALVLDRVNLMGKAPSAVYYGKSLKVIESWIDGKTSPGLADLQKTLERPATTEDRKAINLLSHINVEEGVIMVSPERPRMPVMICMPIKGDCAALIMATMFAIGVKHAPFLNIQADTLLVRARNLLTDRFLRTDLQWSVWMDSDALAPLGSDMFGRVVGTHKLSMATLQMDFIPRLLSHGVPLVGGVYASRTPGGQLVAQPDLAPRPGTDDELVANAIREGTAKGLCKVDWIPSGACAIHRDVFLKIRQVFEDRVHPPEGEPWPYWNPVFSEGEDIAFCARAREAGFDCWLDTELVLAHKGSTWYMPSGTAPARRLS